MLPLWSRSECVESAPPDRDVRNRKYQISEYHYDRLWYFSHKIFLHNLTKYQYELLMEHLQWIRWRMRMSRCSCGASPILFFVYFVFISRFLAGLKKLMEEYVVVRPREVLRFTYTKTLWSVSFFETRAEWFLRGSDQKLSCSEIYLDPSPVYLIFLWIWNLNVARVNASCGKSENQVLWFFLKTER